ncbi:MAG TPA: hypothetical protein VK497_00455 [Candidatus Saccharimonadales bacterium]|nr:hypothetical protein [Candidatus Saccharimonadales bacterium]
MMATTKKKPIEHRSFRKSPNPSPFFTLKFTHQSVYWLILCGLILALGIWVLSLNMKLQAAYDQIDESNNSSNVHY